MDLLFRGEKLQNKVLRAIPFEILRGAEWEKIWGGSVKKIKICGGGVAPKKYAGGSPEKIRGAHQKKCRGSAKKMKYMGGGDQ